MIVNSLADIDNDQNNAANANFNKSLNSKLNAVFNCNSNLILIVFKIKIDNKKKKIIAASKCTLPINSMIIKGFKPYSNDE